MNPSSNLSNIANSLSLSGNDQPSTTRLPVQSIDNSDEEPQSAKRAKLDFVDEAMISNEEMTLTKFRINVNSCIADPDNITNNKIKEIWVSYKSFSENELPKEMEAKYQSLLELKDNRTVIESLELLNLAQMAWDASADAFFHTDDDAAETAAIQAECQALKAFIPPQPSEPSSSENESESESAPVNVDMSEPYYLDDSEQLSFDHSEETSTSEQFAINEEASKLAENKINTSFKEAEKSLKQCNEAPQTDDSSLMQQREKFELHVASLILLIKFTKRYLSENYFTQILEKLHKLESEADVLSRLEFAESLLNNSSSAEFGLSHFWLNTGFDRLRNYVSNTKPPKTDRE